MLTRNFDARFSVVPNTKVAFCCSSGIVHGTEPNSGVGGGGSSCMRPTCNYISVLALRKPAAMLTNVFHKRAAHPSEPRKIPPDF
jgi:hypothetical protein